MVHFIGNILTSHEEARAHPESSQAHFHITPEEAASLDATGLPVHLEHADNVRVGHVARSWNDSDGTKWVLADVDESTIEGKFVKNDLASGTPVYGGLSLQHMYRKYADGSSTKSGMEVSICKDPRRPNCGIVHTSSDSSVYKVMPISGRHMTKEETPKEPEVAVETEVSVEASAPPAPSTTQLMAEVVEASRQNSDLQKQLDDRNAELKQITEQSRLEEEASMKQKTQLAEELGNAVLEHVAKLDPALAGEDTTKAIATLREKYPSEVARVLEVACCASKHAKNLEDQLAKQKDESERKLMEQAYHAAVSSRPGCHGAAAAPPPEEAVSVAVPASKRARTEDNPFAVRRTEEASVYAHDSGTMSQIHEAYRELRGSGSTVDAMRQVSGIIGAQREKGFR